MSDEEARLVLIAGEPLDQEIVQVRDFISSCDGEADASPSTVPLS